MAPKKLKPIEVVAPAAEVVGTVSPEAEKVLIQALEAANARIDKLESFINGLMAKTYGKGRRVI